jgi:hypothetical protein
VLTVLDLVLAALAVVIVARPRLARFAAPVALAIVAFRLIDAPYDLWLGYGAWVALGGSILAWAGGVLSARPKITDQCSPATRSSTSPASPASS